MRAFLIALGSVFSLNVLAWFVYWELVVMGLCKRIDPVNGAEAFLICTLCATGACVCFTNLPKKGGRF